MLYDDPYTSLVVVYNAMTKEKTLILPTLGQLSKIVDRVDIPLEI